MTDNYWSGVTSASNSPSSSDEHIKTDPTVPPGFYVAEVLDFGAWRNEESGTWNAKWSLRIIEGAQKDKFLVRWSPMTPEKASANFDLFQNTLGHLPPFDGDHGFADYDAVRRRMRGAVVKVKAEAYTSRNGEKRTWVYINQNVSLGLEPEDSVEPEQVDLIDGDDDADIPF